MSEIDWKHRLSALESQILMREKWRSIGQSQDTMWEAQAIITFPPPTSSSGPYFLATRSLLSTNEVPMFASSPWGGQGTPSTWLCFQLARHSQWPRPHKREAVDQWNHDDVIDSTVVWGEKLHVWGWWGQMFRRQQHLSQIRQQWASSGQQQEDKDWVGTRVV